MVDDFSRRGVGPKVADLAGGIKKMGDTKRELSMVFLVSEIQKLGISMSTEHVAVFWREGIDSIGLRLQYTWHEACSVSMSINTVYLLQSTDNDTPREKK